MSEAAVALYRKYRPQTFRDVLGQEHVVSVLEGALRQGNISHAYLFAGTRGTGKTSVARILASELGTSEKDVYEIDAASNRGIDDIRELREAVTVLPFDSQYKVYIVDEVHMLTKEAFNALLKTLEEPPPHALFILATTELEKLPETIVSRCQTFTFKKPALPLLRQLLLDVAKKEKVALESAAADLIALLSEGSFRDAHGILQKIIASSAKGKINVADVELVTGAPKSVLLGALLESISKRELESALATVREAAAGNVDMKVFMMLLLERMRAVLLLRFAPEMKTSLAEQYSDEDMKLLGALAKEKQSAINADLLRALLEAYEQTGRSYIPQLPLELALISTIGQDSE